MQNEILVFKNISKSFATVKALNNINFEVYQGEVLGLLGANGAGKSTLLKIIGGTQHADSGEIILDGKIYTPKNVIEANTKGVVSVYQELNLFCNMTVAENLYMGAEKRNKVGLIDWKTSYEDADKLLESMGLEQIKSQDIVSNLSVANRQIIEIARAIMAKPKILLLDEPTASLSEEHTKWLFTKIRQLTSEKTTVIYVTHRMDEVMDICDRCIILRDGEKVATFEKENIISDNVVCEMVGFEVNQETDRNNKTNEKEVFQCDNIGLEGIFKDISFSIKSGEILGIAGLVGSKRSELLNAIYGITPITSGEISINKKKLSIGHPSDAIKEGIVLVSEDRKEEGLFLPENIKTNISANTLKNRQRFGFVKDKEEQDSVLKMAGSVCIDTTRIKEPVNLLSGGNQQKVVIGKTLLADSKVLLLDEPTRGVDVGARCEIYNIIKESAKEGKAVLMVSSDWEEITTFADRAIVMSEGRLIGELHGDEITQENMLHLCTEFKTKKTEDEIQLSIKDKMRAQYNKNSNAWILAAMLIILMIIGSFTSEFFFERNNFNNIVYQTILFMFLTIGQLIAIIGGGIDLSLSATMTLSCVVGMKLMIAFPNQQYLGLIAMIIIGLSIGLFNGVLVVYKKIDAFVLTLAVQIVLQGVSYIVSQKPISPAPSFMKYIANGQFIKLPVILYIGIILLILFELFLKYSRSGRYLYAVGESSKGAAWTGLSVDKIKIASFMLASFMAVLAGFYYLGRSGAANPSVNNDLMLNSIAYSLIGGATLAGGKGSLMGSILAALVITVLLNIIGYAGVSLHYQGIIRGTVIMLILIIYEKKRKVV